MAGLLTVYYYLNKTCGINSQGGLIVVFWCILVNQLTLYSCALYLYPYIVGENDPSKVFIFVIALLIVQIIGFLLYPVSGLLADIYWTRYNTMYAGLVISFCGTIFLTISSYAIIFIDQNSILYSWPFLIFFVVLPLGVIQLGVALFSSNAVQFATDQMPTASSRELSSLVHWYVGAIFWGEMEASLILLFLIFFIPFGQAIHVTMLLMCMLQVICLTLGVIIIKKLKIKLVNEPAGRNPIKILKGVLKYVWQHDAPSFQSRSSFTYGDEFPNRFDFAKLRFGGPFTTEQVEDTKSFFRICFIMFSLSGFAIFTDESVSTSNHMRQLNTALNLNSTFYFDYLTIVSFGTSSTLITILILMYQCGLRKCLRKYWPTMLKRMFIGLIGSLIAILVLQIIEVVLTLQLSHITECDRCSLTREEERENCVFNNGTIYSQYEEGNISSLVFNDLFLPYQTIIIARVANGIAFFLIFLTNIEFILAQAPRLMQGFLIGLWHSMAAYKIFLGILAAIRPIDCQVYILSLRAVGMIIFLPIYIIAAWKYKRRTREEYANINAQNVIEEHFIRAMERNKELEKLSSESFFISSL